VLLLAEDMPIIRGQYGEHQGNTAVKVEEIVEIYDPENEDIKSAIAQPD
jgi:flagellar motor switch protein FliM